MQKSESKLIEKIDKMHDKNDKRKLVLAYGAWGLVAGRPNTVGNKGTPPAIGKGLMKKLALHFVVAPTPEHYTSKTCVKCMGMCGPQKTLKTKNGKEIRGLRVCQHEGCGLQNRCYKHRASVCPASTRPSSHSRNGRHGTRVAQTRHVPGL